MQTFAFLKQSLATVVAIMLITCAACNPAGPIPDGDTNAANDTDDHDVAANDGVSIEFGDTGDVLMTIMQDGPGTLTARGTYDDNAVYVTEMAIDTDDGEFNVTIDDENRPTTAVLPDGDAVTLTYNPDGTFNYEWTSAGVVAFSGVNVTPIENGALPKKAVPRLTAPSPEDVLDCGDKFLELGVRGVCSDANVTITGEPKDLPIFERIRYTAYDSLAISVCYLLEGLDAYADELHDRCDRYLPGPDATEEERREAYHRREDCDEWADDIEDSHLWVQAMFYAIMIRASDQLADHLALPQEELRELCAGEEAPAQETCDGTTAAPFANGGFEDVTATSDGIFLGAWESTIGLPLVHPTKIDGEPADMPPGLRAEGDFYLELPPGAAIAQTFETQPDNAYALTFNVAVWNGPRPLIRTNITYAVDENGEPIVKTQDQAQSIVQDPIFNTQRRWGAVCPTSTIEIVNLADQSIFLENVNAYISNRGER
jgi:hypothetical protein